MWRKAGRTLVFQVHIPRLGAPARARPDDPFERGEFDLVSLAALFPAMPSGPASLRQAANKVRSYEEIHASQLLRAAAALPG